MFNIGDYVLYNIEYNTKAISRIDCVYAKDLDEEPLECHYDIADSPFSYREEELVHIKPKFEKGGYARLENKVIRIEAVGYKGDHFVYCANDTEYAEKDLEYVDEARFRLKKGDTVYLNKYAAIETMRGITGRIEYIDYIDSYVKVCLPFGGESSIHTFLWCEVDLMPAKKWTVGYVGDFNLTLCPLFQDCNDKKSAAEEAWSLARTFLAEKVKQEKEIEASIKPSIKDGFPIVKIGKKEIKFYPKEVLNNDI